MMRKRSEFSSFIIVVIALVMSSPVWSQTARNEPVKVEVKPLSKHAKVGDTVPYKIVLKNAAGEPVSAPKAFKIKIETVALSGHKVISELTIDAGATSASGELVIHEPGPVAIKTYQAELPQGGGFVLGTPATIAPRPNLDSSRFRIVPTVGDIRRDPSNRPVVLENRDRVIINRAPAEAADIPNIVMSAPNIRTGNGSSAPTPDPAPTVGDNVSAALMIGTSVENIRADGQEGADVHIFLLGTGPDGLSEVTVRLLSSQGRLEPNPVKIPAGQFTAVAKLTSNVVGESEIRFLGSQPSIPLHSDSDSEFKINFRPPIYQTDVEFSPPEINLLDTAGVVGHLRNAEGLAVATDVKQTMSLTLKEGNGAIVPIDIVFQPGQATARASFRPTSWGTVVITGSVPNFLSRTAQLDVLIPFILIAISIIGGLIGGAIAFTRARRAKDKRWWRIPIGAVTGALLFWGAAVGLVDTIPAAIALSPISAFFVSVLGGAAGSEVISLLLRAVRVPA